MLTPKLTPEDVKLCCVIAAGVGQTSADAISRLSRIFGHIEYDKTLDGACAPSPYETYISGLATAHAFDDFSPYSPAVLAKKDSHNFARTRPVAVDVK